MTKLLLVFFILFVNLYAIDKKKVNDVIIKEIESEKVKYPKIDNNESNNFLIESNKYININNNINDGDSDVLKYKKEISKSIRKSIVNLEFLNNISNGELFKINNNNLLKNKLLIIDDYIISTNKKIELDSIFMFFTMEIEKIEINDNIKKIIIKKGI